MNLQEPNKAKENQDMQRGGKFTADDVAEVRDVVDVRQGAGDEYVPLAFDWKLGDLPIPCDVVRNISHILPTLAFSVLGLGHRVSRASA